MSAFPDVPAPPVVLPLDAVLVPHAASPTRLTHLFLPAMPVLPVRGPPIGPSEPTLEITDGPGMCRASPPAVDGPHRIPRSPP